MQNRTAQSYGASQQQLQGDVCVCLAHCETLPQPAFLTPRNAEAKKQQATVWTPGRIGAIFTRDVTKDSPHNIWRPERGTDHDPRVPFVRHTMFLSFCGLTSPEYLWTVRHKTPQTKNTVATLNVRPIHTKRCSGKMRSAATIHNIETVL